VTWLGGRLLPLLTLCRRFASCSRRQRCMCCRQRYRLLFLIFPPIHLTAIPNRPSQRGLSEDSLEGAQARVQAGPLKHISDGGGGQRQQRLTAAAPDTIPITACLQLIPFPSVSAFLACSNNSDKVPVQLSSYHQCSNRAVRARYASACIMSGMAAAVAAGDSAGSARTAFAALLAPLVGLPARARASSRSLHQAAQAAGRAG
jgi:hypothetical protein